MQPWILYALLSAVSASLVAIFGKIGIAKVDSTLATTIRAGIMALVMIGVATVLGKWRLTHQIDSRAILFISLAGIAGAASWFWYFLALKSGPVGGVVAFDRLSVVFAVGLAALFLGERLTWGSVSGVVLMIAGAILLVR